MLGENKIEKALALTMVFLLMSAGLTLIIFQTSLTGKSDPPFSDDYKVNTDVGTETQSDAAITVNSTGGIHVVWQDFRDGDWNIYYANSSDLGLSWTDPNIRINTDGTIEIRPPHQLQWTHRIIYM